MIRVKSGKKEKQVALKKGDHIRFDKESHTISASSKDCDRLHWEGGDDKVWLPLTFPQMHEVADMIASAVGCTAKFVGDQHEDVIFELV